MTGKTWLLLTFGLVAAVAATGVILTSGTARVDVGPAGTGETPQAAEAPQCDDIRSDGLLRVAAEAEGCRYGGDGEVRLVAVCAITGAVRSSPPAAGAFADGRFSTRPCAFGVRETYFEVDGDRAAAG